MVALGEWRDYGISMLKDVSIFSVYRHASESFILIEKNQKLSKKQEFIQLLLWMVVF